MSRRENKISLSYDEEKINLFLFLRKYGDYVIVVHRDGYYLSYLRYFVRLIYKEN